MRALRLLCLLMLLAEPAGAAGVRLTVFWGDGCLHCEEARPYVTALAAREPRLEVEWVEVRRDAAGRARFLATIDRLHLEGAGVPLFILGERAIVGFRPGVTERELADEVARVLTGGGAQPAPPLVELPLVGPVDTTRIPLPLVTVVIGLLDGLNPCAFYVLAVLLGIMLHAGSRRRMALYGAVFVLMSGVVYFAFMSAWLGAFRLLGISRAVTVALGVALVALGVINLKEIVWWKRGVSLMIPERAKPGLFRRMRRIAQAASFPVALAGIAVLALVVNLVELGCTLGLPAMYTHLLSLKPGLSAPARFGYLALYNLAYVVPLAVIVTVAVATTHKLAVTERRAKVLKAVSGVLLLVLGTLFIAAPSLLVR